MIVYNSLLAKVILGKEEGKIRFGGFCFTKNRFWNIDEYMEVAIYERQYWECVMLVLLPVLVLSLWLSWWFFLLIPLSYNILYGVEWLILHYVVKLDKKVGGELRRFGSYYSAFDLEIRGNRHDLFYLRKRKGFAWMKGYAKK